jgi:tetratricopeptide (TPR) repeat protein
MKSQSEDPSLPIGQRETVILGAAGALDRAAHEAPTMETRQSRWGQAVQLLDGFDAGNPGHPRIAEFQLQSAVYRWAQGQSWRDAADLTPADSSLRDRAATGLDDAIVRLRGLAGKNLEKGVDDNRRFRLARALTDRAELDPPGSGSRQGHDTEALELLGEPMTEPGLKGFTGLLRAELLRRGKKLDEAVAEVAEAAKAQPAPPEREIYETLIPILADQGRYAEAEKAVRNSGQSATAKELQLFRIALARARRAAPGDDRLAHEKELFRQADALRKTRNDESRLALAALARSGLEPDARHEPLAWDTLGEASELLGETERAGAFAEKAARRALELGRAEAAAGYRLRGGGFLFQAGKYAEADALLSRVAADPKAGGFRPRAGMLRALARGRALAAGTEGVTAASYADSLQQQIRDFPRDPSTAEARWLLGSLLLASGEATKAVALWTEIPPGAGRWLDARLGIFEGERRDLEDRLPSGDRRELAAASQKILDALSAALDQAGGEAEQTAIGLAEAELNLLPVVGKPKLAMETLERLASRTMSPSLRYRLRLDRIVAVIHLGPPFHEAEREAQGHPSWAEPTARAAFLGTVRLLDLCASSFDADLRQRRFGLVTRLLIQPVLEAPEEVDWTPEQRSELRVRLARACLFLGDERAAREALRGWTGPPRDAGDRLLRDIADTYSRLEAYGLAVDVQRMRSKNLPAGSPAWFDARYGLALAYFHAGQFREAAQLIDATAILHPDLGGGAVQKKLIRLRQRLGERP